MEFKHLEEESKHILDIMKEVGFSELIIEYSGGNDSGGFDNATATYPDGRKEELSGVNDSSYEHWEGSFALIFHPMRKHDSLKNDLLGTCMRPIYNYYGSFAGEYSVSGTVAVNLANTENPIEINDYYSEYSYEEEENYYDEDDEDEDEEVKVEQPEQ